MLPEPDEKLADLDADVTEHEHAIFTKLRLKSWIDYVTAGTFISQALLARSLPRNLKLQLKKHLRRLESLVTSTDPSEPPNDTSEVMHIIL